MTAADAGLFEALHVRAMELGRAKPLYGTAGGQESILLEDIRKLTW